MGIHDVIWEQAMEHVQAPKDSPAAAATRYGHGLTWRLVAVKQGVGRDSRRYYFS